MILAIIRTSGQSTMARSLQHWYWGPNTNGVQQDTWGSGVVGRPTAFVTSSGEQHVFARGTGGTLEHWWWTSSDGIHHDTWGSGLAGDRPRSRSADYQDVWAVDENGRLQHWYWGPNTNGVVNDTWGSGVVGRPSVVVYGNGDQEAFVRGTGGNVEHFWWDAQLGISRGTGAPGSPRTRPRRSSTTNSTSGHWTLRVMLGIGSGIRPGAAFSTTVGSNT